ncbi:MAG: aldo/keto reductase [Armatimonadota bacterium]|nr:aldo/keto reductase [Armatimonadota bacterium]
MLTGKFHTPDEVSEGRARTRHFSSARPQTRHGEPGCERETFAAIAHIRSMSERLQVPMAELSLAWCLHQPGVTAVIAGARSPAQVRENAAGAERRIEPEVLAELDAATAAVKSALGPNIDAWMPADRARSR